VSSSIANPRALLPDRHRRGDFFLCDIFNAIPKDDMVTMERPILSLSMRPDRRILRYVHNDEEIEVTPNVKGPAKIHDKDIPIHCISQLMAALNAGKTVSRRSHGQRGGDALGLALPGGDYEIRPDAEPGLFPPQEAAGTPHLRNSTQPFPPPGQPARLGRSAAQKSGSACPLRGRRKMLRDMLAAGHLPDYEMAEGDMIRFSLRDAVVEGPVRPPRVLPPEARDAARALAPGWDVREWCSFWAKSGDCAANGVARLRETARRGVWPEVIWFAKLLSIIRLWKIETSCR